MSTEPVFDEDAIWLATERACAEFHRSWLDMDQDAREIARQHMRPRILAAVAVFDEVARRILEGRDDPQP